MGTVPIVRDSSHALGSPTLFFRERSRGAPPQLALRSPLGLRENLLHVVAWNREADAHASRGHLALARAEKRGIDADDVAVKVDQRSTGIARVDRRIGLQESSRIALTQRPVGRANDAAGD